jgi:hypothetical protein
MASWPALFGLLKLGVCGGTIALLASPALADPWRIDRAVDKMSGQSSLKAVATVAADDGHHFELTAECSSGAVNGVVLTVLAVDHDVRFQISETTTTSGSGLFGYSVDTDRRVSSRLRLDEGQIITATPIATYSNEFSLLFADHNRSHSADQSGNDPAQALASIAGVFAEMGAVGDISQLVTGQVLKVQPMLDDGGDPLLAVPLGGEFHRYLVACGTTGSRADRGDNAPPKLGDFSNGKIALSFHEGQVLITIDGQTLKSRTYAVSGATVTFNIENKPVSLTLSGDHQTLTPTVGSEPPLRRVR